MGKNKIDDDENDKTVKDLINLETTLRACCVLWKRGRVRGRSENATSPAHVCLRRRVALAPFVHVCATPAQFLGRPLLLQTMIARMVPSIAIVGSNIGFAWKATRWKTGGWWQLSGATSPRSFAAIY